MSASVISVSMNTRGANFCQSFQLSMKPCARLRISCVISGSFAVVPITTANGVT